MEKESRLKSALECQSGILTDIDGNVVLRFAKSVCAELYEDRTIS